MDCAQLTDLAPELALGALSGEDRGRALAHIAGCDSCRRLVAALTLTADDLLLAAPSIAPPLGFETKVLRRLRPPRRTRWVAAASAAALLLAILGAVLTRGGSTTPARHELRSARGVVIGTAVVYGQPRQLVVDVHDAGYDGACLVRVTPAHGATVTLRGLHLLHGGGSLSTPYSGGDPARIVVTDAEGETLASNDHSAFRR